MKKELIKKHLEGWNGLQKASIDHFAETGKVSGSFFMALKAMMDEYAETVVTNLLQSCVSGELPPSTDEEKIVAKNVELFKKLRDEKSGNFC